MSNLTGEVEFNSRNNKYRLAGRKESPCTTYGVLSRAKNYRMLMNGRNLTFTGNGSEIIRTMDCIFHTLDKANVMARCSLIEL